MVVTSPDGKIVPVQADLQNGGAKISYQCPDSESQIVLFNTCPPETFAIAIADAAEPVQSYCVTHDNNPPGNYECIITLHPANVNMDQPNMEACFRSPRGGQVLAGGGANGRLGVTYAQVEGGNGRVVTVVTTK